MLSRGPTALVLLVGCQYVPPAGPSEVPGDTRQVEPDVLPDPEICTDTVREECLGNTLRECRVVGQLPIDTLCAMCISTPNPHCETLVPSANGATAADLAPNGQLLDITITNGTVADTDSGEIQGVRGGGEGVVDGIGFRVNNDIAIWQFHSLTVSDRISFRGSRAAVVAANRTITVDDVLDVRGECNSQNGGPGGSRGGIGEQDGSGSGKGLRGNGQHDAASGGSGGGHGANGSAGGSANGQSAPTGGATDGDPTITMLRGGSGGGGGGGDATTAGVGGGGGGALQLVANDKIAFTANGGINAGGCGALRVLFQNAGGGGGGAGGTVLLEASEIDLSTAVLAVNGGGGSGGDAFGQSGQSGQRSRTAASGGSGTGGGNGSTGGRGGSGGTGGSPSGTAGASGSSNKNAGGGGGAIGRMRINTRDDANLAGTCSGCSPSFTDTNTTLTRGAVTIVKSP